MTKYETVSSTDFQFAQAIYLNRIANELAESNRLKRLHMQILVTDKFFHTTKGTELERLSIADLLEKAKEDLA